jgi:hypothetical protein
MRAESTDIRLGRWQDAAHGERQCRSSCGRRQPGKRETAMKYMLLIYMHEQAMNEAEREQCYVESVRLTQDLHACGQYITASPLQPVSTATRVRVRDGNPMVTDGPFAETREQLGGFYLIDVKDLDEAIGVAARIPPARKGTVEIRPVLEIPGRAIASKFLTAISTLPAGLRSRNDQIAARAYLRFLRARAGSPD